MPNFVPALVHLFVYLSFHVPSHCLVAPGINCWETSSGSHAQCLPIWAHLLRCLTFPKLVFTQESCHCWKELKQNLKYSHGKVNCDDQLRGSKEVIEEQSSQRGSSKCSLGRGGKGCSRNLIMIPYLQCLFLLSLLSCHLYHPFQEGRCDHEVQESHLLPEGLGDQVSQGCCRCTWESSSLPWPDCPEVVHQHRWQDLSRRAVQSSWALEEKYRHQYTLQGGALAQWS